MRPKLESKQGLENSVGWIGQLQLVQNAASFVKLASLIMSCNTPATWDTVFTSWLLAVIQYVDGYHPQSSTWHIEPSNLRDHTSPLGSTHPECSDSWLASDSINWARSSIGNLRSRICLCWICLLNQPPSPPLQKSTWLPLCPYSSIF